jgi:hypothetical protein
MEFGMRNMMIEQERDITNVITVEIEKKMGTLKIVQLG